MLSINRRNIDMYKIVNRAILIERNPLYNLSITNGKRKKREVPNR